MTFSSHFLLHCCLASLSFPSSTNKMDNSSSSNCTDEINEETIVRGVMGGIGSVTCIVALVFVLVSRFYKDIVQRLILYKLITMLIYSLSLFLFHEFDRSNVYKGFSRIIPATAYYVNLILTFWLTIILFICIVKLKELSNLKKLEPVAIITSFLPFVNFVLAFFTRYSLDKNCVSTWKIIFKKGGKDRIEYVILGYIIVGLLYSIISLLVIIILVTAVKRSQMCKRQITRKHESRLLTNNKWKALSRQLLPIVVYPIINTGLAFAYFPLIFHHVNNKSKSDNIFLYLLHYPNGPVTGIAVILHLCILKYKKKQREWRNSNGRQSLLDYAEALVHDRANENSAMFTSDTLASTNARTEYNYTRTSSFNASML